MKFNQALDIDDVTEDCLGHDSLILRRPRSFAAPSLFLRIRLGREMCIRLTRSSRE